MVVALRAIEAASHEDADLFGHGVVRRSDLVVRQEMARRRLVALRGDPLARDLVVGAVRLDIGANPLPVFRHPLGRQAVAENGDAEEVGEAECPVVDELGRADQRVDHLLPLLRIVAGQEFAHALRRRKRAGEIETDAAQEFGVARQIGRDDLEFAQLVEDVVVDEVRSRRSSG